MRPEWEPDELIACWTLVEADRDLVANKSGATRLGFALLLKFFELEARFPGTSASCLRPPWTRSGARNAPSGWSAATTP